MFSPLARGYGSWTGEINLKTESEVPKSNLETVDEDGSGSHRHGVTVTPCVFRSNTCHSLSSHKDDGQVDLPKTYVTRKGALLLFTAPPTDPEKTKETVKLRHRKKVDNLLDCSLKLNTLERLYLSALQYGDLSGYARDKCSITDPENQWFLKFLHGLDDQHVDTNTQPGGELDTYLRDLRTRASSRVFGSADSSSRKQRSDELRDLLQELDGVWRSKTQTSLKPEASTLSQSRSGQGARILSSKSLTASLKSSTYLGRADSTATNVSDRGGGETVSPILLPDITSKSGKRRRGSWLSSVSATATQEPTKRSASAITLVPTNRNQRSLSAKSGSDGRGSISRSSQLSSSSTGLEEKRSGSSSRIKRGADDKGSTGEDTTMEFGADNESGLIGGDVVNQGNIWKEGDFGREDGIGKGGDGAGKGEGIGNESGIGRYGIMEDIEGVEDVEIMNEVGELLDAIVDAVTSNDMNKEGEGGSTNNKQQSLDQAVSKQNDDDKGSVASSVFEEQDIVLPSDGEETILEFSEQPEEWPTQSNQVKAVDDNLTEESEVKLPIAVDLSIEDDATKSQGEKDPKSIHEETYIPRPPSEPHSSQARRSRLSGRLSATSQGSTEASSGKVISEENVVSTNDVVPVPTQSEPEKGEEDAAAAAAAAADLRLNVQDDTESEQSMSFIFNRDNSISDSTSIGKRNMEEDLAELERRRRKNKLLFGFGNSNYDDDDEEDDFEARAREAKEREMEFIRIIEVDSDTEPANEEEERNVKKQPQKDKSRKQPKKTSGDKVYVQALEITSVAPDKVETEEPEEMSEEEKDEGPWVHPNQQFFPEGPLPKFVVPEDDAMVPSQLQEMLNRRSASKSAEELEFELLQMQDILNKDLAGSSLMVDEGEVGLTEEELKLAQEVLQDRVKEVSSKIFNTEGAEEEEKEEKKDDIKGKKKSSKTSKKGGKSKKKPKMVEEPEPVDRKKSVAEERDSIRQRRKLEKQKRLAEMKELQEKIIARQEERKAKEEEAQNKAKELVEEQQALEEQAAFIRQDEAEARQQLATVRQSQRMERDTRRKAEQERRRQLAISRRQKEKEMRDKARENEIEMLRTLGSADNVRQLIEEEELKQEEEERLAQESFEEEMREQQLLLEEDEVRARELEREAEEEAMQRLVLEREAAERRQRQLKEEEEALLKEEELLRQDILLEEERLQEEKRLKELQEEEKIEQEKQRLQQLKKLEEEARSTMRVELEYKKEYALKRREQNLERRSHLDKLGYGQGLTRPWVFSYFALCPSVSYNRSVDTDPLTKKGIELRLKPSEGSGNQDSALTTIIEE